MTALAYLSTNLWWPFAAVSACFGAGVGIGHLLTRTRGRRT